MGWLGTRNPTVSCPPVMKFLARSLLLRISVIGPGQNVRARAIAYSGMSDIQG
ncbi:unannotated protein [freshwater metagenome]|uniref:Unannotated protein n=1 Tax=freshwater metagenome TaxID=449393 RepID=A0A6J7BEF1_9ZZZZ